jgi:hypothetical protein
MEETTKKINAIPPTVNGGIPCLQPAVRRGAGFGGIVGLGDRTDSDQSRRGCDIECHVRPQRNLAGEEASVMEKHGTAAAFAGVDRSLPSSSSRQRT